LHSSSMHAFVYLIIYIIVEACHFFGTLSIHTLSFIE